jgi:hypothetical protein
LEDGVEREVGDGGHHLEMMMGLAR